MTFLDNFLVRAALAGVGVAIAAGPLGCLVVWRRLAYFGDATAHAAILGVAMSLAFNVSIFIGVLATALLMSVMVTVLSGRGYASDTLLGVIAHSSLAIGLVAVSLMSSVRLDLMSYLFGDVLAVSQTDLAVIWGGAILVLGLLAWRWQALLTATLNEEMAFASGIDPKREELILTLALAAVIAVSIKVVGVLLIGSLLLIPAATARPFAQTPERMAILSVGVGIASVFAGLYAAFRFDTPTGPTIVCGAAALFAFGNLINFYKKKMLRL